MVSLPDCKHLAWASEASYYGNVASRFPMMCRYTEAPEGHRGTLGSVAFSPDCKNVASASDDGTIKTWDTETGKSIQTLESGISSIHLVIYSPDGNNIGSASNDGTVRIWNASTGQLSENIEGKYGSAYFMSDSKHLMFKSDSNSRYWNPDTGQCEKARRRKWHRSAIALSLDGRHLVWWLHGEPVTICDSSTGQLIQELSGDFENDNLVFSSNTTRPSWCLNIGSHIPKSNGSCATIQIFDATRGGLAMSHVALQSGAGDVSIWDAATGRHIRDVEFKFSTYPDSLVCSPDGNLFASTADVEKCTTIWDAASGQCIERLEGHGGEIILLAFSPNSRYLASGSNDGTIKI